jgi:hypothetical protein
MRQDYTEFNKQSTTEYPSIDDVEDAIDFLKAPASFRSFRTGLIKIFLDKYIENISDNSDSIDINFINIDSNNIDLTNIDSNNIVLSNIAPINIDSINIDSTKSESVRINSMEPESVDSYAEEQMAKCLFNKLHKIGSSIEYNTVLSWFQGKHRPKVEAGYRQQIYEICFALNLTFDETKWFFGHVYYDRAFNCHTIEEAVFYYAFRNNVGYQEALEIIDTIYASNSTIESISPSEISAYPTENYTLFVQEHISDMHSKEEIIDFLTANKDNFNEWNKTAFANLNNLVKTLIVSDAAKKEIHNLKRLLTRRINSNNIDNSEHIKINHSDKCGLIMKEILYDAKKSSSFDKYIYETINGKNVCSNTFILERLLSSSTGLPKSPDIPYIVRNNFPNKKVMSDILSEQKVSLSKSYDGIRKMIILLDFYSFWVNIKLGISDMSEYSASERFTTYIDEANALLHKCGYEDLFEGNPYDWVFICSAKNDEPLDFFRSCVNELLES